MATYAIGDIQGCMRSLEALLGRIGYRRGHDRLWLTGDLVNRGPDSLAVLRWARQQGSSVVAVLGNHDLHLLGLAFGLREPRKGDTLAPVLRSADRGELVEWLLCRPLLHEEGGRLLVHAGLPPLWRLSLARALAEEATATLRHDPHRALRAWAERGASRWDGGGRRRERLTQTLRGLTLLRTVHADGRPRDGFSGPPSEAPAGCVPWFEMRSDEVTFVCGHWAALGLRIAPRLLALDSGCVWGGFLSAVRLLDREVFAQPSLDR